MRAYIGLGSNLGDGPGMIMAGLAELDKHDSVRLVRRSGLYRTEAWGLEDQPEFTNAVAEIESDMTAEDLLSVLLNTELALGRKRDSVRWGPRLIDIDLLCCGDYESDGPKLELPHPRMHQRAFVLVPLLELEAEFIIPGMGSARTCLDALGDQRVKRLE